MWNHFSFMDARAIGQRAFLGRAIPLVGMGQAGSEAAANVARAQGLLNRVRANYGRLAAIIGEGEAAQAVAEAEAALRSAQGV